MSDRSERAARNGDEVYALAWPAAMPARRARTDAAMDVARTAHGPSARVPAGEMSPPELSRTLREIASRLDALFVQVVPDASGTHAQEEEAEADPAPDRARGTDCGGPTPGVDTTIWTIHRDGAIDVAPAGGAIVEGTGEDREDSALDADDAPRAPGGAASTQAPSVPATVHAATREAGGLDERLRAARERMSERKAESERAAEEARGWPRRKTRGSAVRRSEGGTTAATSPRTTSEHRPLATRARRLVRRTGRAATRLALGLAIAVVSAVVAAQLT